MEHYQTPPQNTSLDRRQWAIFSFLLAVFFIVQYVPLSMIDLEGFTSLDTFEALSRSITEGDPKRQAALGLLGLFGFISLFGKHASPLRINGPLGWLVLFYLYWVFMSIIWANDYALTFRRLVIFAFSCLGALAVVRRFRFEDLIRFTFLSTSIYLLIGLAVEITHGRFHPFTAEYRFAGTFHPNYQGLNCTLLLLTAIFLAKKAKGSTLFYYVAALTGFGFLFITKSRTSLVCAICALLLYWFMVSSAFRKWQLVLGAGWCGSLILLLYGDTIISHNWKPDFPGRESADIETLTGRIPLWEECLKYFIKQPLLGYGYNGFWTPKHADAISYRIGWWPYASHSVYIDLLLGLGIIGMLAYVMINFVALGRSYRRFKDSDNAGYAFIAALLACCLLNGFLESTLLNPNLLTFLSMAALASLAFSTPFPGQMHVQD
jgi:O-antigen ligase